LAYDFWHCHSGVTRQGAVALAKKSLACVAGAIAGKAANANKKVKQLMKT
jgi:predicted protein tyrosine phosphatase